MSIIKPAVVIIHGESRTGKTQLLPHIRNAFGISAENVIDGWGGESFRPGMLKNRGHYILVITNMFPALLNEHVSLLHREGHPTILYHIDDVKRTLVGRLDLELVDIHPRTSCEHDFIPHMFPDNRLNYLMCRTCGARKDYDHGK